MLFEYDKKNTDTKIHKCLLIFRHKRISKVKARQGNNSIRQNFMEVPKRTRWKHKANAIIPVTRNLSYFPVNYNYVRQTCIIK
jgi:hypothetical protein